MMSPRLSYAAQTEEAAFNASMSLYKNGKFEESSKILSDLVKQNPQKSLYWFNLGNCAYMDKKYDRAVKAYKKVIAINSNLVSAAMLYEAKSLAKLNLTDDATALLEELIDLNPPPGILKEAQKDLSDLDKQQDTEDSALSLFQNGEYQETENLLKQKKESELSASGKLLLALTYIRQNKMYEAERTLKAVLKSPQLSDDDKMTATDLLAKVRRNEAENYPYWLFVDLSYGYTSNAFLDGKSAAAVSSALTRATLGFGYHYNQGQSLSEKLGYILNYESPQKAPELQTVSHTVQAPIIFEKSGFESSLTPYLQYQVWNSTPASTKLGGTFRLSYLTSTYDFGLDLDAASQSSNNSTYNYLSGNSRSARPYFGFWGSAVYLQFYWLSGYDGTQDIVYSDDSLLPLEQNYQGPGLKLIWRISSSATMISNLSYLSRHYTNPALPEDKKRDDSEVGLSLKYNYNVTTKFSVYAMEEFTTNSSTLGESDVRDKNYNVSITSVGLTWDAF
jgi:tetratricopeptide (TPR) repeat protein